jgi:hypothetical protein
MVEVCQINEQRPGRRVRKFISDIWAEAVQKSGAKAAQISEKRLVR